MDNRPQLQGQCGRIDAIEWVTKEGQGFTVWEEIGNFPVMNN